MNKQDRFSENSSCTTNETFQGLLLKYRGPRSQTMIGELAGLSGKRISAYENGALPKDERYVIAIAEALQLTREQTAHFLHVYHCNKMQRSGIACHLCVYHLARHQLMPSLAPSARLSRTYTYFKEIKPQNDAADANTTL